MQRFTFVTEVAGSTIIAQVRARSLPQAIRSWCAESAVDYEDLLRHGLQEPTPIERLESVWCVTGNTTSGKRFITHIVATAGALSLENAGAPAALRRAAMKDSWSAAFTLGRLYDEGWGVEQNARAATRWYRRAAESGLPEAYYFLATAYWLGRGIRRSEAKAFHWFRRSAASGDLTGEYMVARFTFDGTGTDRDEKRGLELLRRAAARGSAEAMDSLAVHYLERGNPRLAKRWCDRAIAASDQVAPLRLPEIEAWLKGGGARPRTSRACVDGAGKHVRSSVARLTR